MTWQTLATSGPISADTRAPNVLVPSGSGQHIRLAREGKLARLVNLWKKRTELDAELSRIRRALENCNNRIWLLQFHTQMRRQGRKFEPALREHVNQLEGRKAALLDRLARNLHQIEEIDPFLLDTPPPAQESTDGKSPTLKPVRLNPKRNIPVLVRDLSIAKHGHVSNREICRKLDSELMQRDAPPVGLPGSWIESYGVKLYVDAYDDSRCTNLVQKLIWEAKQKTSGLP